MSEQTTPRIDDGTPTRACWFCAAPNPAAAAICGFCSHRADDNPNQPPDDGTPTNDPDAALHFAAMALGLAEARAAQGQRLTEAEYAAFERYQDAALAHGFTGEQIRARKDAIDAAVTA